jgi:SpoIID/LytB domain protein
MIEMRPSPLLRVAVVQGEPEIVLSGDRSFTVMGGGRVISTGKRRAEFRFTAKAHGATESVYRVFLRDFPSVEKARRFIDDGSLERFDPEVIRIGRAFELQGKEIHDNTAFRVVAGEFGDETEAGKRMDALRKRGFRPWTDREFRLSKRDRIEVKGTFGVPLAVPPPLVLRSDDPKTRFTVRSAPVGRGFHFEHREDLTFPGPLSVNPGPFGTVTLVNDIPLENYLASVNSSEMPPDSPIELLKAQTVAARGTALTTAGRHHVGVPFDLCATDHCQVYRGESVVRESSLESVRSTFGEVLVFGDRVCDPRYSKICGGVTERFENVWPGEAKPYLSSVLDGPELVQNEIPWDLSTDEGAREFVESSPPCYCNAEAHDVPKTLRKLGQDFRWRQEYSRVHLEKILAKKTGCTVGTIRALEPLKRGDSGRILELRVVGSKSSVVLRSELEIRRALSESHLKSSAFVIDLETSADGTIERVVLRGSGWGHGVGMCQVGAASMAHQGKNYKEILAHYYGGAEFRMLY